MRIKEEVGPQWLIGRRVVNVGKKTDENNEVILPPVPEFQQKQQKDTQDSNVLAT